MNITRVGLDIAKQVFQVHGVDEHGKARLRKKLSASRDAGILRPAAAEPYRYRGLRQCTLLGA